MPRPRLILVSGLAAVVVAVAVVAVWYFEFRPRPFFIADPKRWPTAPAAVPGRTVKILGPTGDPARGVDCAVFDSDFGREAYGLFAETGSFEPGCDLASFESKERRSDAFSAVVLRSNDDGIVVVPFTERPLLIAARTAGLFAARLLKPTERGDGTLSLSPERTFEAEVVTTDGTKAAFAGVELRRRRGPVYVDRRFAVADAEGRVSMRNPFRTEGDDSFSSLLEGRSDPGGSYVTTSIQPSDPFAGWDPCEEFALALAGAESDVTPAGPDRVVLRASRPLKLRAFNLGPASGVLSLAPAVEPDHGRYDTGGSRPRFRFTSPGARSARNVEAPHSSVFQVALPETAFVARFHTDAGVFIAESGSRGTTEVVEFKPVGEDTVRLFCKEAAGLEAAFALFATDAARGSLAGATVRIRSRFDETGVCTLPISRTPFSEGHARITVTAVIAAAGVFPTPEIVLRGNAELERTSAGGSPRALAPTFVASFSRLLTERPVFAADFVADSGLPAAGRRVRVTTPFGFRLAADGSEFSSYPQCDAVVPADGRFVIYGSGGGEGTGDATTAFARVRWMSEDAADDQDQMPVVTHTDGVGHARIVLPKP